MLSEAQMAQFWSKGFLLVENAIEPDLLRQLKSQFNEWVVESRSHSEAYGKTIDGRARFDLEPTHNADKPELRRVNSPTDVSAPYFEAMANSAVADCVSDLIGPNIKIHHSKVNSKLPRSKTSVKWHQDFPFTPHSNDDLITALIMVDTVTEENGPLEVVEGSHTGPIYDLWHDGVFTGAVSDDITDECIKKAVKCTGEEGSVCLMHTRLLHGSAPNLSNNPRTLFIGVYSSEDAIPYSPNPVPTMHEGHVVRGIKTNKVRSVSYEIPLPQKPDTASFFNQQALHKNTEQ